MLSRYQESEIIFGTLIFALLYYLYRTYVDESKYLLFDVLYSSMGVLIILFMKNFASSYYQLYQNQT